MTNITSCFQVDLCNNCQTCMYVCVCAMCIWMYVCNSELSDLKISKMCESKATNVWLILQTIFNFLHHDVVVVVAVVWMMMMTASLSSVHCELPLKKKDLNNPVKYYEHNGT